MQDPREVLPSTPAGERAAWVLGRLLDVARGGEPPEHPELVEQYAPAWLAEVPIGPAFFTAHAPVVGATATLHPEAPRANEARVLLELEDGSYVRFRIAVEDVAPHRVTFQLLSPALDPARSVHRVVEHNERSVHVRDYGGDGPVVVLWHGSGCDATVWDGMATYLESFRVIAPDLPGHGESQLPNLTVAATIADTEAVLDGLRLRDPYVVGHSVGGWIALHYAAVSDSCRGLVCLDGPTALDSAAMSLSPDHPGFVPDPPDVVADLEAVRCPTLITLCAGTSPAETEWMVPFRRGLSDHIDRTSRPVRVEWSSTGHMLVVSHPEQTAERVAQFVREHVS